jgi:hypothetical protein
VLVNGLAQSPAVTLTATLDAVSLDADVRVVGAGEVPLLAGITPSTPVISVGATQSFTVSLDIPAPAGGTVVNLSVAPSDAGTLPPTVTVAAGQISASFDYTDAGTQTSATVTATLGASMVSATVTVSSCTITHLLISEVRSRGAGGANDEFIEIYNPTGSQVTLDPTWKIEGRSHSSLTFATRWTGTGASIPAHGHYLLYGSLYTQMPSGDAALTSGFTDAGALRLVQSSTPVDTVCFAFDATTLNALTGDATFGCEGTPISSNPHNNTTGTNTDASIERKPGGAAGSCQDTADSVTDFESIAPAAPQNTSSPVTP